MSRSRRIAVVAIGGNSLIRDKDHQTVEDQYLAAKETTAHVAEMIAAGWRVAIGHGNGPQVGFILRRSEIAHKVEGMHELPLDVCGADSQGAIGYALQQTLQNWLFKRDIHVNVATVITQVLVDRDDPAFDSPSKPIGGFMDEEEAKAARGDDGLVRGRGRRPRLAPRGRLADAQGGRRARHRPGADQRGGGRHQRRRGRDPGRRQGRRRVRRHRRRDRQGLRQQPARPDDPRRPVPDLDGAWTRSRSTSASPTSSGSTA